MIDQGGSKPVLPHLLTSWVQYFLLLCKERSIGTSLPTYRDPIIRLGRRRAGMSARQTPHWGHYGQKPGGPGLRSLWGLAGQHKDSADGPLVPLGLPGKTQQRVWFGRFQSQASIQESAPSSSDGSTKSNVFPAAFGVSFLWVNGVKALHMPGGLQLWFLQLLCCIGRNLYLN